MSSEQDARQAPRADQGPESPRPEPPDELRLTDPKAMRALAHPVRMALLELFAVSETLTATQASETLRESPANCAFHLRTLAKYGYIKEAGGGRGRERPWTRTHRSLILSSEDQQPQSAAAAKALENVIIEQILDRIRRTLTADSWPAGWEHAASSSIGIFHLTLEENAQVAEEMYRVLEKYENRRFDPSLRPAGALPVEFSRFSYPRADLAGLSGPPPAGKETDE